MNEPKMPEENKDWNAINIFLFSNGQEYSPPRKYHLVSQELKSWENVKNYLAQAQYGPQTPTIELYSLDGKKINTPLELNDSAAYVAIKPPDEFIQTGYSQYLIKASRSWEKRQEKILKSEDMAVIEDGNKTVQAKSDVMAGMEYVKRVEDLTSAGHISDKAIENYKKTVTKPNPQLRKNNIVIKRQQHKMISADKNKNSDSNSNKNIHNQINSKRKEVSYLKCIKDTPKRASILTKNIKGNIFKPNSNPKTPDQNVTNVKKISKTEIESDLKTILSNQNTAFLKSEIDINFKTTGVDSKVIQTNTIYKEQENLPTPQVDEIIAIAKNGLDLQNKQKDNYDTCTFDKAEDSLSLIEDRKKSVPKVRLTKDQSISINRGGVIKLKFNIEVRDFQSYSNQDKKDSLKTTQSFIPLVATEKASQVNINNTNLSDVTLLKYEKNLLKKEESFESLFTINRDIFSNNENPKIIIINCSCNQFDTESKNIQMQCEKNNGNLIYLIPSSERNAKAEICTCDKNIFKVKQDEEMIDDFITNKITDRRVSISPYQTQEMYIDRKNIKSDAAESKRKSSILQSQSIKRDVQTQTETIDQNLQKQPDQEVTMVKDDKNTQTEWCNIVLEARRQEDGHYALHLPPLQALLRNHFY